MKEFIGTVEDLLGITPEIQTKIVHSFFAVVLVYAISYLIILFVKNHSENVKTVYVWSKTIGYMRMFLLLIIVGRIWFEGIETFGTYLGLLSAGVAIALKDPISNLAGWIFIIWRRPFELGDRIETGSHRGDVIDIRIFQFTIMEIGNWVEGDQSTGRIIHIPNGSLFINPLANYNKAFQFIWDEIAVLVTFESDWKKAKKILDKISQEINVGMDKLAQQKIKESAKKYMIYYKNLTPIVYTSVKDSGVLLTVRYLCEPRGRRGKQNDIWEKILSEFALYDDIDFAYPTTRFFDNAGESKITHKD
jgi:small-conductance mechanosensitive channel